MPAQKAVQGVARVSVRGTANGVQVVNVFHVRNGTATGAGYTVAGVSSLANSMINIYNGRIRPSLATTWSADDISVQDLSSVIAPGVILPMSMSGAAAVTTTPQSVACAITWKIGRHYRGGHPRTYVGPLGTASLEGPTSFAAAFLTTLLTNASAMITDINGLTIEGTPQQFVCVHRWVNNAQLDVPLVSPILAVQIDSRIDTQRRRLGRDR